VGAQPILVVPWVTSEKLRPESLPFLPAGLYDTHPSRGTADPHRCMWVLSEVEPPGGMAILPGVRGYDYEPVAVLEVGEGDWSRLSAATTRGDQEQDWRAAECSPNPSAAYPVNEPVELPDDFHEPGAPHGRHALAPLCLGGTSQAICWP
jgi:hypothetical protein